MHLEVKNFATIVANLAISQGIAKSQKDQGALRVSILDRAEAEAMICAENSAESAGTGARAGEGDRDIIPSPLLTTTSRWHTPATLLLKPLSHPDLMAEHRLK